MPQFHSNLADTKKTTYYFWLFILIHTLIWTIGPALLRPTIPHDTLEGISWGLQWQLGYNKHPFLAAWLSAGITELFGITGWPTYLLAQMAVSATFIAAWKLAQEILPLPQALIAALLLEGVLFYNINSFNFTPDTLQSPLWAALSLFFYRALTRQNLSNWLYTGLFAALCLCTKYQAGLLFIPMFLLCLCNANARKSFKTPFIYCGIALFLLLISPHLKWLYEHQFITLTYATEISTEYTQKKSILNHLTNPLGFLSNSFIDVLGLFILLWPFYKKEKSKLSLNSLQWQFLLYLGLGPLVLSFILCSFSGDYFPPRWSTPYFFAWGIIAISYLKPSLSKKQLKQFALTLIIVSTLLFTIRMITLSIFPRAHSDAFLPNQQIALSLEKTWYQYYRRPLPYLAGSHYLVTGTTPYMSNKPIPYLSLQIEDSAWINEEKIQQQGGLFIWDKGGHYTWDKASRNSMNLSEEALKRFPRLKFLNDQIYYRLSDKEPVIIGVAILPPQ